MSFNRFSSKVALLVAAVAMGVAAVAMPAPATAQDMTVRISEDDLGKAASTRRIIVPLYKSKIIELPVDARDVLASNPGVADAVVRTPRLIYVVGNQIGQTNVFVFDNDGKRVLNLEICVEQDVIPLRNMLRKYLPDSRIEVSAIKDTIVLSGTVRNATQADRARQIATQFLSDPNRGDDGVVNLIAIEGAEQVLLKVRIVEMQRSVSKQLGLDITSAVQVGDFRTGAITENLFSLTGSALSGSTYFLDFANGAGDIVENTLSALERVGMVRTLAEPNLTAVSGEAANFLVGGEFPVPVGRDNNGQVTIVFKQFGVGLAFTPVVLNEGLISLKISTEVSELASEDAFSIGGSVLVDDDGNFVEFGGISVPGLTVRRAETSVELPSGGSMAIAGLLQDTLKQNIDGIPGVKDMPVIGALARSRDFQNNQTELVIMVTPYLVGPTSEKNLVTPDRKFVPPSDAQTILFGKLNAKYGDGQLPQTRTFRGPSGFIVE